MGGYDDSWLGLWIYEMDTQKVSKVIDGPVTMAAWPLDANRMTFDLWIPYYEIWVAELKPDVSTIEALGPGRTLNDHNQYMTRRYTRAIGTDPLDAENYFRRARCYVYLQEDKKAFADLDKCAGIVKNPSRAAEAYGSLGLDLVLRRQQMVNPEIAVKLLGKAHAIAPNIWSYLAGLGMAHYRAGQWVEAIAEFTKSTQLPGGENSINYFVLSMAHWQLGRKEKAVNWHNKAIEWIQNSNIYADLQHEQVADYIYAADYIYVEAAELMGVKIKEYYRKVPLTGEGIPSVTARADSSHSEMTPACIVDGSGLADGDHDKQLEHDENTRNMWLSKQGQTSGWIEFDLRGVYELGSILVWNYNERGHTKRGIKRADISVWTQDTGWQKISDDTEFAEAEGSFDYDEPIVVKFDGAKARKIRFDNLANFGDEEHVGLSEVRFFEKRKP